MGRNARWRSASVAARRSADGVVAMEWKEMGGEKGSVKISERSCANEGKRPVDMSERSWADESGQCGRKAMDGNRWGVKTSGHE